MPSLSTLPADLILLIADWLFGDDVKHLSSINSTFRDRLASTVFHRLRVTNTSECARALGEVAHKYGHHVQAITFIEHATIWKEAEALLKLAPNRSSFWYEMPETLWDPSANPVLDCGVGKILEGHVFPQARSVTVHFNYVRFMSFWSCACDWDCVEKARSAVEFEVDEDIFSLPEKESQWRWRALMVEVWLALGKNIHIRNLQIDPLISKLVTSFTTEPFRIMLSRLEALQIVTQDLTGDGHALFLSRLDETFFNYTASLRSLNIQFPYIVHLPSSLQFAAALKASDMPFLQRLELHKSFVGQELIEFMMGHTRTLRTVVLDGCMCSPNNSAVHWPAIDFKPKMKWADIFKSVRTQSIALTEFEVTPRDGFHHPTLKGGQYDCAQSRENRHGLPTRDWFEERQHGRDPGREPEEITVVRRKLEADPRLWGFEYFEITRTPNGGVLVPAGQALGIREFERGDDQREFELLQEMLEQRRVAR